MEQTIRRIQWGLTALIVAIAGIIQSRVFENSDLLRGRAGAAQLSDNPGTIIAAREVLNHDYSWPITFVIVAILLLIVWFAPAILRAIGILPPREDRDPPSGSPYRSLFLMITLLSAFMPFLAACAAPGSATVKYDTYNVGPSETVFSIPASETDQQVKFQSEQYLNENKLPTRQIKVTYSRFDLSNGLGTRFGWKADTLYFIVDRTPESREWTADAKTGTETSDQSFKAESNEAIDFSIGGTCTARVTEEQAAKFLYNFNGTGSVAIESDVTKTEVLPPSIFKQANIGAVMDKQVRAFFQQHLFETFHSMSTNDIRLKAGEVFRQVSADATKYFGDRGLTLEGCGGVGGLTYSDANVQNVINATFAEQQKIIQAQAQAEAQKTKAQGDYNAQDLQNKTALSKAEADAQSARIRAKGEADAMAAKGAVLAQNPGIIDLIRAEKYKGDVPSTVVNPGPGQAPNVILPAGNGQ